MKLAARKSPRLGRLSSLPFEILSIISEELDFKSLARLRLTNTTFRETVDSLAVWRDVHVAAYDTLWALKYCRLIGHHTSNKLRMAVSDDRCYTCDLDHHGPFIHLETLRRVCYYHVAKKWCPFRHSVPGLIYLEELLDNHCVV